jgi:hypothetical protein
MSSTSAESVLNEQSIDSDSFKLHKNEMLVQEAIYVLTGKSGKYLKKDVAGDFKLKSRSISTQEALSLLRLAEIGRLYNEIHKYTDVNSEFFLFGLFGQGLIAQVQNGKELL